MFYGHFSAHGRLNEWAERPPNVMKRSQRWNKLQIYANAEILTQMIMIYGSTRYQLDHGGLLDICWSVCCLYKHMRCMGPVSHTLILINMCKPQITIYRKITDIDSRMLFRDIDYTNKTNTRTMKFWARVIRNHLPLFFGRDPWLVKEHIHILLSILLPIYCEQF